MRRPLRKRPKCQEKCWFDTLQRSFFHAHTSGWIIMNGVLPGSCYAKVCCIYLFWSLSWLLCTSFLFEKVVLWCFFWCRAFHGLLYQYIGAHRKYRAWHHSIVPSKPPTILYQTWQMAPWLNAEKLEVLLSYGTFWLMFSRGCCGQRKRYLLHKDF